MVAHVNTRIRVLKETLLIAIQIKLHFKEYTFMHVFETIKIRMHPALDELVEKHSVYFLVSIRAFAHAVKAICAVQEHGAPRVLSNMCCTLEYLAAALTSA